jgi:NAD(P)H-dependent FMN reductase
MKLGIVSGSHRKPSQSHKVASYIEKQALQKGFFSSSWLYDLGDNPLPLWDEGLWREDRAWETLLRPLSLELQACSAFILVTPEWHGMVPAGLKNFLLLWSQSELAHKPALLVSVSAASGGSYPIAELRMSGYKNNRLCMLPEHLIIRNVKEVMNEDAADNTAATHDYLHARLQYCLRLLAEYAKALGSVRASGAGDLSEFPHGM